MKPAPLIVFAFNRPDTLQNTLSSLQRNDLAKDTELFVFVDGPRNDSDVEKIERGVLEKGCKEEKLSVEQVRLFRGLTRITEIIIGMRKLVLFDEIRKFPKLGAFNSGIPQDFFEVIAAGNHKYGKIVTLIIGISASNL